VSGFSNAIIGGAQKLIRRAIQSPNYVPATTGWSINKDGSAEFSTLTSRGMIVVQSSTGGVFVYSGTPANGNLIASMASASGTDAYGNTYPQGFGASVGSMAGGIIQPGTVTAAAIAAGAIVAGKIAAGAIDAMTITGATVQTAASGARLAMTGNTLVMYDAGGLVVMSQDATTGKLTIYQTGSAQKAYVRMDTAFGTPEVAINVNSAKYVADGGMGHTETAGDGGIPTTQISSGASGGRNSAQLILFGQSTTTGSSAPVAEFTVGAGGAVITDAPIYPFNSGTGVVETWHAVPLAAGWTNFGAGHPTAQYRKLASPANCIEVIGRTSHAAVAGTTALSTALPAGYRPTNAQDVPCATFGNTASAVASAVLTLDTAGVLSFFNLPTGTTNCFFHCIYSLDA
jgi:hypothetical protein